jgi:hypothetical protein
LSRNDVKNLCASKKQALERCCEFSSKCFYSSIFKFILHWEDPTDEKAKRFQQQLVNFGKDVPSKGPASAEEEWGWTGPEESKRAGCLFVIFKLSMMMNDDDERPFFWFEIFPTKIIY